MADPLGPSGLVSDTSDDGDDSDGNKENDVTIVEMTSASSQTTIFPELEVIKSAVVSDTGNDGNNLGDVITFFITIKNKGNIGLSGLTLTETFTDGNDQSLTLANPSFVSASIGSTSSTLAVGGVVTYTATFAINQQAVDSGQVENNNATASTPGGTNDVRDTSDDPSTNVLDDSTIVTLVATPTLSVSKSALLNDPDSNGVDSSDTITYTIVVTNTGILP